MRSAHFKGLGIGVWVAQVILALAFAGAGAGKLVNSAVFAERMGVAGGLVRFIGICELAGALGVVLPAATRITPWLTPLAALLLAVVMLLATGYHIMRGETGPLGVVLVLGALAMFVAGARWRVVPITAR